MLHKAKLNNAEPVVRRLEYRVTRPMVNVGLKSFEPPQKETTEAVANERALVTARMQELQKQLADREELFTHQLAAAQKEAFELGRNEAEAARHGAVKQAAASLDRTLAEFGAARDGYLAQVEHEVVRLALSIARRVLHREAQMDPLLLTGAVRVALGQLADSTEVRLRVPAAEHDLWSEFIRLLPNLPLRPQLVLDETLEVGGCTLETQLGSVDLNVKAQLAEIERGFFDLLDRREPMRREEQKDRQEVDRVER